MTKKKSSSKATRSRLRNLCVYCGSGSGKNPAYKAAARTLGRALADNGIGLVYGGGNLGLMGEVARETLRYGGNVIGIIPDFLLTKEQMLRDVQELIVTQDMHERKMLMFERSDAFAALPGGIGTLEELVEQLTWLQLGRHTKPIVVANIEGFWNPLLNLLDHMKADSFLRDGLDVTFSVVTDASEIIPAAAAAISKRKAPPDSAIIEKF